MADAAKPLFPLARVQPPLPASGERTHPAPVLLMLDFRTHCRSCSTRELCLPVGLTTEEMNRVDELIGHRTKIRKHATLYFAGAPFHSLYAIQIGSLKTTRSSDDGREQVTGYHLPGEIIGFEGIAADRYGANVTALVDSEVCVLPFSSIEDLARTMPALQRNLTRFMSTQMTQDRGMMLLLGSMHADERLAAFLVNLSDRYQGRGHSAVEFELRLTRDEIGSYLGLRLETVSRQFSRFHQEGLIHIQGRTVKLLDLRALRTLVSRYQ